MSVEKETRAVRVPTPVQVRIVAATCDRCGKSALCRNASARHGWFKPGPWCEVDAVIQGGGENYHADLCLDCSEELQKWIGAA